MSFEKYIFTIHGLQSANHLFPSTAATAQIKFTGETYLRITIFLSLCTVWMRDFVLTIDQRTNNKSERVHAKCIICARGLCINFVCLLLPDIGHD